MRIKSMNQRFFIILSGILIFSSSVTAQPGSSEKVWVFPFQIHATDDMAYLGNEIKKALEINLKADGATIITPDHSVSGQATDGKGKMDPQLLRQAGRQLGADFILWGSLTWVDGQYSIDSHLIQTLTEDAPRSFYAAGKGIATIPTTVAELSKELGFTLFKREKVTSVTISGNQRIESDAILKNVKTKAGDVFLTRSLSEDLKRIYAMGYFEDVRIESEEGPTGKNIIIKVKEKPVIREIQFKGNRVFDDDDLMATLDIKNGSVININSIRRNIQRLEDQYREKNYQNVNIEYEVASVEKNRGDLVFTIDEGEKVRIQTISFEGNSAYSDDDLKDEMKTSEKGFFSWLTSSGDLNKEDLEQDVARLSAFYQNNGYIKARIGEPQVTFKGKWIHIKIKVFEGPRFKVGDIQLSGDLILPADEIKNELATTEERYFNRQILRNDIVALNDIYSNEGYAYAEMIPNLNQDNDNKVVDISIRIKKGAPVYFERINISGNDRTRDKVIRRELEISEGELFSSKKLKRGMRNLHRLGYFDDVQLDTRKGSSDDRMVLDLEVKEKSTGNLSFGGGYSSVEKVFVQGSIQERNLFGYGLTLNLKANVGDTTKRFNLDLIEPWLFDIPLSAGVGLYRWNYDYDTYEKESTGGSIRAGYPVFTDTRLFLKYYYDIADVSDIDEDAAQSIKELEGENITSAVSTTLRYDSRNRFFYTTHGQDHRVDVEYAGIGGDINFLKYTGELGIYFPLIKGLVGFLHAEGGYVVEHSEGLLPDYEKFYMGGIHSLRGFEWREVSTTDESGDEIGGNKYVQFNAEMHIPLLKDQGILGVLFYDTGNVFGEDETIDLGNLRQTAGYGIRWNSPVGPIRLERGHILDPQGDEDSGGRWEFAMEASF